MVVERVLVAFVGGNVTQVGDSIPAVCGAIALAGQILSLVGDPCAVNPDAKLRSYAKQQGWRIRDYRTGRKAAKVGLLTAAGAGAATGSVAAAFALRRRHPR